MSKEVICYGIASVYTPEYNRSKGYARHMMRLLHWMLAPRAYLGDFPSAWGEPPVGPELLLCGDAVFSALWSDVGTFYGTCGPSPTARGWTICGNESTTWNIANPKTGFEKKEVSGWTWVGPDDIKGLMVDESERMTDDVTKYGDSSAPPRFTFLPLNGVEEFQRLRMQVRLGKANLEPKWWGIIASSGAKDGFISWTVELDPTSLVITRLRVKTSSQFREAMEKIISYAKSIGLERVEIWSVPKDLQGTASEIGGQTVVRGEHLPAYCWYGQEQEVEWVFNEK